METLRMVGIIVFMIISVISFVAFLKYDKRTKVLFPTMITFSFFTFVLLFSDKAGEFAAEILGNKMTAKFDEIKKSQDNYQTISLGGQQKLISEQKKLSDAFDKIQKIIDLKDKKPKPMILWGPEAEEDAKAHEDSIAVKKKELNDIVNPPILK